MDEARKKGTKVLGLINFDAIESAWQAILEKEAEDASNTETSEKENELESENETPDEDPAIVQRTAFHRIL